MHLTNEQIGQIRDILGDPCLIDIKLQEVVFTTASAINSSMVGDIAKVSHPNAVVVHIKDDLHLNVTVS
jgi:hypothetical protein